MAVLLTYLQCFIIITNYFIQPQCVQSMIVAWICSSVLIDIFGSKHNLKFNIRKGNGSNLAQKIVPFVC